MSCGMGGYGGKPWKVAERSGPSVRWAAKPEPKASAALKRAGEPGVHEGLRVDAARAVGKRVIRLLDLVLLDVGSCNDIAPSPVVARLLRELHRGKVAAAENDKHGAIEGLEPHRHPLLEWLLWCRSGFPPRGGGDCARELAHCA